MSLRPIIVGSVTLLVVAVGMETVRAMPGAEQPAQRPSTERPADSPPETGAAADELSCGKVEAPTAMVCLAGGPAVIGSDTDSPAERPRHEVYVSTFFIDQREVTNAEYRACVRTEACPKAGRAARGGRSLSGANQPFVNATWEMANRYCIWAGKRLPTEAEWEKAARAGARAQRYPWGDEDPSCERAIYDACPPKRTRPTGSLPAGAFGLHDMAGNGSEWVSDWASACYDGCEGACGEPCRERDPQGPCRGALRCESSKQRLIKGGSWTGTADQLRGSWRLARAPTREGNRAGFRCAASSPRLTRAPFWHLQRRESLPLPPRPSAEELALFNQVRDDDDILKIPVCEEKCVATHECRDPISYVKGNEGLRRHFTPFIRNLGGGYVGIGSDQAYDFISTARSRWAWLFDYDPEVVRVHQMIRAVVLQSKSREEFLDAFLEENLPLTKRWIRRSLKGRRSEIAPTIATFQRNREVLHEYYLDASETRPFFPNFGWLANSTNYRYVRRMFQQGRVQIRKGNLLTDVAMPDIAKSARALGVPVRIFYTSNADDQWAYSEQYRQNILGLPFDPHSLVLRTLLARHIEEVDDNEYSKWLYAVHGAEHLRRKLRRNRTHLTADLMVEAVPTAHEKLFTIGLPGRDE